MKKTIMFIHTIFCPIGKFPQENRSPFYNYTIKV